MSTDETLQTLRAERDAALAVMREIKCELDAARAKVDAMAALLYRSDDDHSIKIPVPPRVLSGSRLTWDAFRQEAAAAMASQLFAQGVLTSGQACQLCGMGRAEFLAQLGARGIPIMTIDVAEEDLDA